MKKFLDVLLIIVIIAIILGACFFAYKYFTKEDTATIPLSQTFNANLMNQVYETTSQAIAEEKLMYESQRQLLKQVD